MSKCGRAETHCCWFGTACPFVVPSNVEGFKWACLLRIKYGSWAAVHAAPEYIEKVKPWMYSAGYQIDCGDWPPKGITCNDCGEVGHG